MPSPNWLSDLSQDLGPAPKYNPGESTWGGLALRVLPGIAGGFLAGPAGAFAGGALGEGLAEWYDGGDLNPWAIGLGGAINTLPGFSGLGSVRGLTGVAARMGMHGLTGAAVGGLTNPIVQNVQQSGWEGFDPTTWGNDTWDQVKSGAAGGFVMGSLGGGAVEGLNKYLGRGPYDMPLPPKPDDWIPKSRPAPGFGDPTDPAEQDKLFAYLMNRGNSGWAPPETIGPDLPNQPPAPPSSIRRVPPDAASIADEYAAFMGGGDTWAPPDLPPVDVPPAPPAYDEQLAAILGYNSPADFPVGVDSAPRWEFDETTGWGGVRTPGAGRPTIDNSFMRDLATMTGQDLTLDDRYMLASLAGEIGATTDLRPTTRGGKPGFTSGTRILNLAQEMGIQPRQGNRLTYGSLQDTIRAVLTNEGDVAPATRDRLIEWARALQQGFDPETGNFREGTPSAPTSTPFHALTEPTGLEGVKDWPEDLVRRYMKRIPAEDVAPVAEPDVVPSDVSAAPGGEGPVQSSADLEQAFNDFVDQLAAEEAAARAATAADGSVPAAEPGADVPLPGLDGVRGENRPMPELDAPFSLTPDAAAQAAERAALAAQEAKAQGSLLAPEDPLASVLAPDAPTAPAAPKAQDPLDAFLNQEPQVVETNGSGESAASVEALNRQEAMRARGEQFVVFDRAGNARPLIGPDAADYTPRPGETYGVQGPDGFRVLEDNGGRPPSGSSASAGASEGPAVERFPLFIRSSRSTADVVGGTEIERAAMALSEGRVRASDEPAVRQWVMDQTGLSASGVDRLGEAAANQARAALAQAETALRGQRGASIDRVPMPNVWQGDPSAFEPGAPKGRKGEAGFIRPHAAATVGGAVAGGAAGFLSGPDDQTTADRVKRAGVGALIGAGAGFGLASATGTLARPAGSPSGTVPPEGPASARSTSESTARPKAAAETPIAQANRTVQTPEGRTVTLPKYAGDININLERIDTVDGVKQVIHEVAKGLGRTGDAAPQSQAWQRALAEENGMTLEQLVARRKGGFKPWEALAARQLQVKSAENLTAALKAFQGAKSPENYAGFMQALQYHAALQSEVQGMTAEAGRMLAMYREVARSKGSLPDLNELITQAGGTTKLEAIADRLSKLDPTNLRAVNQFVREAVKAKTIDKVHEVWLNAMLSGPVTHVANMLSNGLTAGFVPLERGMAGLLDALRSTGGGQRERFAREAASSLVGMWKGVPGALRAALTAFSTETAQFGASKGESAGVAIKGKAGGLVRLPMRALLASDEFFKGIVYSGDLHARAVRAALMEGKRGRAVGTRAAEFLANPRLMKSEVVTDRGTVAGSEKEAIYRTFNRPLTGPVERHLMALRNAAPLARWIVPFMRTPVNVARFGVERTPLHLIDVVQKIASGDLKAGELSDEAAKIAVGSLMAFGVASAYQSGMITGGGSPKRAEHATAAVTRPAYSVRVGDKWYSYSRLEPLGISMGLVADFMEALDTGKKDISEVPVKVLHAFSKNLQSKTFLQGLTDFFNVLSDYPRYGEEYTKKLAGSIVPNAIAQFSRANDPVIRKPATVREAISNRMGGGDAIPPMIDVFGHPLVNEAGPLERLISPIQRTSVKSDPVIDELQRLGVSLSVPSSTLTVKKDVKLEDTWDQSTLAQARGRAVEQALRKLLTSPTYQRRDDADKADLIQHATQTARNRVSSKARARARTGQPLTLESLLGMR